MIKDILDELKYSKNIFYGDEIYILPYHLINDNNCFDDLKKVSVVSVTTEGKNNKGCEVIGKVISYDNNSYPVETFYSGYAIYRASGNKVVTNNGEYSVCFNEDIHEYYLTKEDNLRLYYKFMASNGIYVQLQVGGDYCFSSVEEAMVLSKRIRIKRCLLDSQGISLVINNTKVIFKNYSIIIGNKFYNDEKMKKDLWQHMICNETPYEQNIYHMDYSKIFKLEPIGFVVE